MNQSQLAEYVALHSDVAKKDALKTLDLLGEAIALTLETGGFVRIAGIGIFKRSLLGARTLKNIRTGDLIKVKARYRIAFKPVKKIKETIN